jgi:ATP phosphoribosyltransferase
MTRLTLAIPSKGRLKEQTEDWLSARSVTLVQDGGARGYAARLDAAPEVEVRLASASEIAHGLIAGDIHLGVTGEDLLREYAADLDARVVLTAGLGFGFADLVIAAPERWADVTTVADLAEVAAAWRADTGRRLRVATKFVRLVSTFLTQGGVADFRIVESLSATEGAPAAGLAEIVADITTTGSTLRDNHLKILADGVVLRSQATLASARAADWSAQARAAAASLAVKLGLDGLAPV